MDGRETDTHIKNGWIVTVAGQYLTPIGQLNSPDSRKALVLPTKADAQVWADRVGGRCVPADPFEGLS